MEDQESSQLLQMLKRKKATLAKTVVVLAPSILPSSAFTPAAMGMSSGGREKNRNFLKKMDIFVFLFLGMEKPKILRETFMWSFFYELTEKEFNFFPVSKKYFRIS